MIRKRALFKWLMLICLGLAPIFMAAADPSLADQAGLAPSFMAAADPSLADQAGLAPSFMAAADPSLANQAGLAPSFMAAADPSLANQAGLAPSFMAAADPSLANQAGLAPSFMAAADPSLANQAGLAPSFMAAADPSLANQAGFMTMEPVTFWFQYGSYFERLVLKSSRARIFYSFLGADRDLPDTPLFVFFNGGPGSATSCGLMSMYTGRYTLDNQEESGGDHYIANPVSWTRLGHLLYIDARQAGFSYNIMERDEDVNERLREFNAQNFNSFFDAADFIRLLLRFLASHSQLQGRPVVIVGESYGGTRAIAMLHILLNYSDYGNGRETFQDPALVDEIQAHYDAVFPEYAGRTVPASVIARQYGRQVLVQPTVSMGYQSAIAEEMLRQPGSILYRIGGEVGIPYDPLRYPDQFEYVHDVAGRDLYIYSKPSDWLSGFFDNAGLRLRTVNNLSLVTGVEARAIGELYAASRSAAYRVIDADSPWAYANESDSPLTRALFEAPARLESAGGLEEPGDMTDVFGVLQPWDRFSSAATPTPTGPSMSATWRWRGATTSITGSPATAGCSSRTSPMCAPSSPMPPSTWWCTRRPCRPPWPGTAKSWLPSAMKGKVRKRAPGGSSLNTCPGFSPTFPL